MAKKHTEAELKEALAAVEKYGTPLRAAEALGIPRTTLASRYERAKAELGDGRSSAAPSMGSDDDLVSRILRQRQYSLSELSEKTKISQAKLAKIIAGLRKGGSNVLQFGDHFSIEKAPALRRAGEVGFSFKSDKDGRYRFGFATDNHIGSKYARLDVLEDLYGKFEAAGITTVFNAGNWIDGEARFNKHDLLVHGMDNQLALLAARYPARHGMTTYSVAGDDHEGWYAQREGVDIGRYAERVMRDNNRTDWINMGYMEADVRLVHAKTGAHAVVRVVHPGGGSAYALSYSVQKLVESYEGGDKPGAVLVGHYHKMDAFNYRNVWCIQGGTTEDQTPFMRKKKIEAHVGGVIVEFEQDPHTGALIECSTRMFRYFNRGYYEDRNDRWSHGHRPRQASRALGGV